MVFLYQIPPIGGIVSGWMMALKIPQKWVLPPLTFLTEQLIRLEYWLRTLRGWTLEQTLRQTLLPLLNKYIIRLEYWLRTLRWWTLRRTLRRTLWSSGCCSWLVHVLSCQEKTGTEKVPFFSQTIRKTFIPSMQPVKFPLEICMSQKIAKTF